MYNIIAQNPQTKKEVVVENFVSNTGKALAWWKKNGMTNVIYSFKLSKIYKRKS